MLIYLTVVSFQCISIWIQFRTLLNEGLSRVASKTKRRVDKRFTTFQWVVKGLYSGSSVQAASHRPVQGHFLSGGKRCRSELFCILSWTATSVVPNMPAISRFFGAKDTACAVEVRGLNFRVSKIIQDGIASSCAWGNLRFSLYVFWRVCCWWMLSGLTQVSFTL